MQTYETWTKAQLIEHIACSCISDVCDFRPEFRGVGFWEPAIHDLAAEADGYIEGMLQSYEHHMSTRSRNTCHTWTDQIKSAIRLQLCIPQR